MARFLVVFLKFRKSRKRQAKSWEWTGRPVIDFGENLRRWLSRIQFILLQIDRLQLTSVYCNRRGGVKTTPQMTRFRDVQQAIIYGYSLNWRWQDKNGLQHQEEEKTWNYVCVVKPHEKTSDTNDDVTTKTNMVHSSTLSPPFHPTSSSPCSSSISCSSCCPSTSTRLVVTLRTPPTRRWGLRTNPTSQQVMSPKPTTSWRLMSSPSQSPWPSHSSLSNGFSKMRCFITHNEKHVYHSQREVFVCWSVVVVRVRKNGETRCWENRELVVERGQELNTEHAQIRNLLDRQKEQILAECQAEIKRHEFQANYDRRSVQQLSEPVESQQEELHRAQAAELQRRDQQLLPSYHSNTGNYVKLILKVSMKWMNWRSFRVPPSTLLQDED